MLWCRFCYHDRYEALRFLVIRTNALHEGSPSLGIVGEQHWALLLYLNLTGETQHVSGRSREVTKASRLMVRLLSFSAT
jgi:hypothetical protein